MADSSFVSQRSKYDVFLSFRGEDTRTTFIDHLYTALLKNGITTFKDDEKIESNASFKAIEESRFAIVVFSKSYGSSSWCLDELVKILECSKRKELFVLPVYYYDFNPSNLRRHGSVFGELFGIHEMEKVSAWTSALVEAANLSGLGLIDYRNQSKHIKEIVEMVLSKLNIENVYFNQNATGMEPEKLVDTTSSHEKLVGIEPRVQQVKKLLQAETMKTTSNSASASPQYSRWTYDVFLSFKGNDTCKDFADQLQFGLEQKGIYAFSNEHEFGRDESISSEHLKAIEESSIAVVIFSKKYADDCWCLDELVKIMNCHEEFGQIVFPVFYDMDPSDVRNKDGLFGQALMRDNPEKAEKLKKALVKAASLAGWYLKLEGAPESHEATIINNIVDMISRKLVCLPSSVDDTLIGIEARMKHVMPLLELESGGVHMLGIWGMGGIGKTTLARAVFDQVSVNFDGSCFVENIREKSKEYGIEYIQKEVLSKLFSLNLESANELTNLIREHLGRRRVFMVLDDVDDMSQLEALAGECNWFGEGSRIIITTRDENVLVTHNIMQNYFVTPLDNYESTHFIKRYAFKKDDHTKGYENHISQVVAYAGGLPLALRALSLLLCGKSKREWENTLARLKVFPEKQIEDVLKISYDSLNDDVKDIFLDIACFFNVMEKDKVVRILDSCGFDGDNGIRILQQKSLVCISNKGFINMHNLLEQMGRDIGKHSRLWQAEEVYDVLMEKTGRKEISAIVVDDMYDQDAVDLRGMENLRLLQIHSGYKLRFLQGPNYLPNDLRWLTWENYPLKSLPKTFQANKLVSLELLYCNISELEFGDKYMGTLHFLNLSYCTKLIKTPEFTKTPNLEELHLENCTSLKTVHKSVGLLKRLTLLNLTRCENLSSLPLSILKLSSLRCLNLSGCINLTQTKLMLQSSPIVYFRRLVELDLRSLSLRKSLGSLKYQKGFALHDTLRDMVLKLAVYENLGDILVSTSDDGLTSESQTSQELIEYNKETLPLLPWKKGV